MKTDDKPPASWADSNADALFWVIALAGTALFSLAVVAFAV